MLRAMFFLLLVGFVVAPPVLPRVITWCDCDDDLLSDSPCACETISVYAEPEAAGAVQ